MACRTRRRIRKGGSRKGNRHRNGHRVHFNSSATPAMNESNYSHLPNTYLDELLEMLDTRRAPVSETHAMNAEIMAEIQNSYNDPMNMQKAIRLIYNPQPLTPAETAVARSLLSQGLKKGINRAAIAPLNPELRLRILNYFRYARAQQKIQHMYETEHVPHPKFVHAEWTRSNNTNK